MNPFVVIMYWLSSNLWLICMSAHKGAWSPIINAGPLFMVLQQPRGSVSDLINTHHQFEQNRGSYEIQTLLVIFMQPG